MDRHFFTKDCCTLTDEEVKDLVARYQAGDSDAAVPLIQSQSAWIMSLVAKLNIPARVSIDDIYSELTLAFLTGLLSYNPTISQPSTYFMLIYSRRIYDIIASLNDEAINIEPSESSKTTSTCCDLEDDESLQVIADIMHTHLTAFERSVMLDYIQDIPIQVVADRATEFVVQRQPEATSAFTVHTIKKHIDNAIGIIKDELKRRGDVESDEPFQGRLF